MSRWILVLVLPGLAACGLLPPVPTDGDLDGYYADATDYEGVSDCDDTDPETYPGVAETCDGKDNNCDGLTPQDELDADSDGVLLCEGDCDDSDPEIHSGAAEVCNGSDDDCDGLTPQDELDADSDGERPCEGDCDDGDPDVHPGATEEACDGTDSDCDPLTPDEERDADLDGLSPCDGDCDDSDPEVYPGAFEDLDEVDSNCNGFVNQVDRIAGTDWTPCQGDCPASTAKLYYPRSIAFDPGTGFYIATQDHRIWLQSGDDIRVIAGTGYPGKSADGADAADAPLDGPRGLAVGYGDDRALYVADYGNSRVLRIDLADASIEVFATMGECQASDGDPAAGALCGEPQDVFAHSDGAVYIAQLYGPPVLQIRDGRAYTILGENGSEGCVADCSSVECSLVSGPHALAFGPATDISALVEASPSLFVADPSPRIAEISTETAEGVTSPLEAFTLVRKGSNGACPTHYLADYLTVGGIAIDGATLYYADSGLFTVQALSLEVSGTDLVPPEQIAGKPSTAGYEDGVGSNARFDAPADLALDSAGLLHVADQNNGRIRQVDPGTGEVTTTAGAAIYGDGGDKGPASAAQLHFPVGLALHNGLLYVTDYGNNVIRQIDLAADGGVPLMYAAAGSGNPGGNDSEYASLVPLYSPRDVAVDDEGALYISDTQHFCVRRVKDGAVTTLKPDRSFCASGDDQTDTLYPIRPLGLAWSDEALYVVDGISGMVLRCAPEGDACTWEIAAGTPASCDPDVSSAGDGGVATDAVLHLPQDVVFSTDGRLFISEEGTPRIRVVDPEGIITTLAASTQLKSVSVGQMAWDDATGTLWALEYGHADSTLVRFVGKNLEKLQMVIGDEKRYGYGKDAGALIEMRIHVGTGDSAGGGLAVGPDGTIYVSDTGNHRILRIRL